MQCLRNATCKCDACTEAMNNFSVADFNKPLLEGLPPDKGVFENEQEAVNPIDYENESIQNLLTNINWKIRKIGYDRIYSKNLEITGDEILSCLSEKSLAAYPSAVQAVHGAFKKVKNVGEFDMESILNKIILRGFNSKKIPRSQTAQFICNIIEKGGIVTYQEIIEIIVNYLLGRKVKIKLNPKAIQGSLFVLNAIVLSFGLAGNLKQAVLNDLKASVLVALNQRQPESRKLGIDLSVTVNNFTKGTFCSLLEIEDVKKFSSQTQKQKILESVQLKYNDSILPELKLHGIEDTVSESTEAVEDQIYTTLNAKEIVNNISFFFSEVKNKKWIVRKEAYVKVRNLCGTIGAVKLAPNDNYSDLLHEIRLTLDKDSNFVVNVEAIKLCSVLLSGLRASFLKYIMVILPLVLPKLKDKRKQGEVAVNQFLDLYSKYLFSLDETCERSVTVILKCLQKSNHKTAPVIQRQRVSAWLLMLSESDIFLGSESQAQVSILRMLLSTLKEACSDPDKIVRKYAVQAIRIFHSYEANSIIQSNVDAIMDQHSKLFQKLKISNQKNKPVNNEARKANIAKIENTPEDNKIQRPKSKRKVNHDSSIMAFPSFDESLEYVVESFENFDKEYASFTSANDWHTKLKFYEFFSQSVTDSTIKMQPIKLVVILSDITSGFTEKNFNLLNMCWKILLELSKSHCKDTDSNILSLLVKPLVNNFSEKKQQKHIQLLLADLGSCFHPNAIIEMVQNEFIKKSRRNLERKIQINVLKTYHFLIRSFGVFNCDVFSICAISVVFGTHGARIDKVVHSEAAIILSEVKAAFGVKFPSVFKDENLRDMATIKFDLKTSKVKIKEETFLPIRSSRCKDEKIILDRVKLVRFDIASYIRTMNIIQKLTSNTDAQSWKIRFEGLKILQDVLMKQNNSMEFEGTFKDFKCTVDAIKDRLQETNKNLILKAIICLGLMGPLLVGHPKRERFFFKIIAPQVISHLTDKKKAIIDAIVSASKQWTYSQNCCCLLLNASIKHVLKAKESHGLFLEYIVSSGKQYFDPHNGHTDEDLTTLCRLCLCFMQSKDSAVRKNSLTLAQLCFINFDHNMCQNIFQRLLRDMKPAIRKDLNQVISEVLAKLDSTQAASGSSEKVLPGISGNTSDTKNSNKPEMNIVTFIERKLNIAVKQRQQREEQLQVTSWSLKLDKEEKLRVFQEFEKYVKASGLFPKTITLEIFFSLDKPKLLQELQLLSEGMKQENKSREVAFCIAYFDQLCKYFAILLEYDSAQFSLTVLGLITSCICVEKNQSQVKKSQSVLILVPHLLEKATTERFRNECMTILDTIFSSTASEFKEELLNMSLKPLAQAATKGQFYTSLTQITTEYLNKFQCEVFEFKQAVEVVKHLGVALALLEKNRTIKDAILILFRKIFESLNYSKRKLLKLLAHCNNLPQRVNDIILAELTSSKLSDEIEQETDLGVSDDQEKILQADWIKTPFADRTGPIKNFFTEFSTPVPPDKPDLSVVMKQNDILTPKTPQRRVRVPNLGRIHETSTLSRDTEKLCSTPTTPSTKSTTFNTALENDVITCGNAILQAQEITSKALFQYYSKLSSVEILDERIIKNQILVFNQAASNVNFLQYCLPIITKSSLSLTTKQLLRDNIVNLLKRIKHQGKKLVIPNTKKVVETLDNLYSCKDNVEMVEVVLNELIRSGYSIGEYVSAGSQIKIPLAKCILKNRKLKPVVITPVQATKEKDVRVKESEDRFNAILKRIQSRKKSL